MPVLIDLHWLPYPHRVIYKICVLMFKWFALIFALFFSPFALVFALDLPYRYFCTKTRQFLFVLALRYVVREDLNVTGQRIGMRLESFCRAGPIVKMCWL